jgi:hypothetical protein
MINVFFFCLNRDIDQSFKIYTNFMTGTLLDKKEHT